LTGLVARLIIFGLVLGFVVTVANQVVQLLKNLGWL
jgi:hypothetical protein